MNLFVDYVHPLTEWLQNNPNWSLFITFLISLAESLAIIGSIVPGSVTMTAIGILAGSGVMRIDLTLFAAILGAVAGDSLSYALGYIYSEQLSEIWPFNQNSKWLQYGKDFFATHGGKSVLIGRFVGPLRSIIPVIAGIMHMKHWRFLIANVLSAIGWSILYVMPGVVIGAATHELPAESATRLFALIIALLLAIWLFSLILKWIIKLLNSILKLYLYDLWLKFKNNPFLAMIYNAVTPENEENPYITPSLVFIILFCILCFFILLGLTLEKDWLTIVNLPTYLFLQSFNILLLKAFFIFCTQLTCKGTIISLFIICCCWFIYHKNSKAIFYLLSLLIFSTIVALILKYCIYIPRPSGLLVVMPGSSFPAANLEIATALYGFILFYINNVYSLSTNTLKMLLFTVLGLSGLGSIYLGDNWLTDVLASYFSGAAIGLIHCLRYRKANFRHKELHPLLMITSLFIVTLLSTALSTYFNFQTLSYNHTPYYKRFSLSEKTWWRQKKPILPVYQLSRIGKRISLLNIQFVGNLDLLQNVLEQNGWESHIDSFFVNLLMRMSEQTKAIKLPLFTQLYKNKAPVLIMTYTDQKSQLNLELRIWESNYNLIEINKPIWIGSVHQSTLVNKTTNNHINDHKLINPLPYMLPIENPFVIRKIKLPKTMIKTTLYPTRPYIILIKNKNPES